MAKDTKQAEQREQLNQIVEQLLKENAEYAAQTQSVEEHEFAQAMLIQGMVEGNVTPKILLIALVDGHWGTVADTAKFDEFAYTLLQDVSGDWPVFAVVKDSSNQAILSLFGSDGSAGTHTIDKLPALEEMLSFERLERDPTFRWSMKIYTRLMQRFDAFHENVFHTTKDNLNGKNDIIDEVAKILFLESFRIYHADITFNDRNGNLYKFSDIFNATYVKQHSEKAVSLIKTAFDTFKSHEDYIVISEDGKRNPIFADEIHLMLSEPRNYENLLEAIQNLGPVTTNDGRVLKEQGTLGDVSGDLLGRVFDVFLRANFESKGGLGIYLTPNPVKQAMVEMAIHDLSADDQFMARFSNGDFRFCDPTCGSFGFGSVALSQFDHLIDTQLVGLNDVEKKNLKQKIRDESLVGADAAPRMVMLARVNMALQGAAKAKIVKTDSLTTKALVPCSFDLICTNPPFGSSSSKKDSGSKKFHQDNMEQILGGFRPTEKVEISYNAYYDHVKMGWQDTGPLELDENGEPKWAGYRTDLRPVGGTEKKPLYRLFATVSGLALGSKPDNKGYWKPVGANIDPAVLFIDRCLQLLKPGGRLFIVLPDGVLCNSGDRYVREYIMGKKDEQTGEFVGGKAIVKAVISLPSDTFKLSGTGAKTSILYLQKRAANPEKPEEFLAEPQTDVFMAVADTLGYLVKNNIEDYNAGVPNDLDTIVKAYKRGI